MNNVSGQKQGSPQYMNQPCPGYSTGMPGQSGLPMTTMPPAMQPGQNLLSQMPTGMPGGPLYRAFPDSQQRMPDQAQVPSTPMAPEWANLCLRSQRHQSYLGIVQCL